ncbi:MAG: hypothetical protein ACR2Q4_01625 [Geminicoccaceae bacterium]
MLSYLRIFGVAGLAVMLNTVPAAAVEYQCQLGDSFIRLAVEVGKEGHTLPCEVIAEDDKGERVTLFRAQYDRNYCPQRIENRRAEIEEKGWTCRKSSDDYVVKGTGKLQPAENAAALTTSEDRTTNDNGTKVEETSADEITEGEEVSVATKAAEIVETGAGVAETGAEVAETRECRRGDDVRLLKIKVDDPERGKPCELIYWAEDDRSEEGKLLWRAEHDADFCPTRLNFILQKWSVEGWQCDDQPTTAAAEPAEPTEPITTATAESTDEPETASPAPVATAETGATTLAAPTAAPVDPELQAVIEADAKRIGEWMEVEPAIEVAARGDLNDDGSEDAVVFLAYQSDHAAYRQYLMSYLVADESYELASVKLLTGVNPPPAHAKVEQIDKGVIWLNLPNDSDTEQNPTGYVLRDQQLIEIDEPAPETPN